MAKDKGTAEEAATSADWGALFRRDVESLVSREVVEAAVVGGRPELRPVPRADYVSFADPSGGSADAMTLVDSRPSSTSCGSGGPFSPDAVTAEFCALLKSYCVGHVA